MSDRSLVPYPTWLAAASGALLLLGCAASRPPATAATPPDNTAATQLTSAPLPEPLITDRETMAQDADAVCGLVMESAQIVPRPAELPDLHANAVADANRVLADMNDDILACYKLRIKQSPSAHAFLTTDILVGKDGHVLRVDTTGGALLGDKAMACIVHRIEQAKFAPPYGGGTRHITVPFNLRKVVPGEEP
jgi:hypothetical protein